jgi:hypothetical protein
VVAAGAEIVMFVVYPQIFGEKPSLVILHAAVAITFVLFRAAIFYQRARQARAARIDLP